MNIPRASVTGSKEAHPEARDAARTSRLPLKERLTSNMSQICLSRGGGNVCVTNLVLLLLGDADYSTGRILQQCSVQGQ